MCEEENKNGKTAGDVPEELLKTGSVTGDNAIQCLTVIGQIEGHYILGDNQKATKYEHLIPLLVSMEQNKDVEGVLIISVPIV